MNFKKQLKEGLITQNPVLIQLLGMCSVMAITTMLFNGLGMGLSVTIVLICCNICISALRKIIPNDIRIAVYVVFIAGFVTIVQLLLKAYIPALDKSLGVFIPLIVVNCIIIGRAESFAAKNSIGASALDGLFQGLGYTLVLLAMCIIREFLGKGTFGGGLLDTSTGALRVVMDGSGSGIELFPATYGITVMILPVGGFLTLGCLIALMQYLLRKSEEKKAAKGENVK